MTTAAALAALHAEAFAEPWTEKAFADLLAQSGVAALTADGGFILIRVAADEAEILTLVVRPSARRRGTGAALVRRAAETALALGATKLFLEVAEDNAAARALYAASGFIEAGRRPGYYARPGGAREDALLLALNLPEPLPSPAALP